MKQDKQNQEVNKLIKSLDKPYKVIDAFVNDYCKSEKDKKEFYKALNKIIDTDIEITEIRARHE